MSLVLACASQQQHDVIGVGMRNAAATWHHWSWHVRDVVAVGMCIAAATCTSGKPWCFKVVLITLMSLLSHATKLHVEVCCRCMPGAQR